MSPSDDAFAFLVSRGPVAEATSAAAWLQALLDVEARLAGAQADAGDIPEAAAETIAGACLVEQFDVATILDEAADGGNPVIPLVTALRQHVGEATAEHVHRGATSQDVVDAATLVVVRRCAEIVCAGLRHASTVIDGLEARHGDVAMIARTLGQHALPTTFTTVTGRWHDGLAEAAAALGDVPTPVGLGGPTGDGTSFGERHAVIVERFAAAPGSALAIGSRPHAAGHDGSDRRGMGAGRRSGRQGRSGHRAARPE